jgi:hypothetical protein
MPICDICKHPLWCHHQVSGKCESYKWIKTNGPFPLPENLIKLGMNGISYESEYGPPCECMNPGLFMKILT